MIVRKGLTGGTVMTMPDEGAGRLKSQDVARVLRLSPRTVKRWADRGLLDGSVTLGPGPSHLPTDDEAVADRTEGRDPEP